MQKAPSLSHLSLLVFFMLIASLARGQKIDSIFFHLYTDSLKKGTYNYINVDGKSSTGQWIPLTDVQLIFSATAGRFENNNLILPVDFAERKVTVAVVLRADTSIRKEKTIYIKTMPDNERLKTAEEIRQETKRKP